MICPNAITNFIFVDDVISPCDIILVPGGSHPQLAEKVSDLYELGMAEYILYSGHANPSIPNFPSEAQYLKSLTVEFGVPHNSIICEEKAAHTFENAEFSLAVINKMGVKAERVILVCKSFHSRRVLSTYQHVFPKDTTFLVASVTDNRGLGKHNWTTKQEYVDRVMSEVEKIGKYFKDKIVL